MLKLIINDTDMDKKPSIEEIFKNRIKFYSEVSNEPLVYIQEIRVIKHNDESDNKLAIYLKYDLQDKDDLKKFTDHEEIETFDDEKGWKLLFNKTKPSEMAKYLKTAKDADFDISNVKIKERHDN